MVAPLSRGVYVSHRRDTLPGSWGMMHGGLVIYVKDGPPDLFECTF